MLHVLVQSCVPRQPPVVVYTSRIACHPCAGAKLSFSVLVQCQPMIPKGNPTTKSHFGFLAIGMQRSYASVPANGTVHMAPDGRDAAQGPTIRPVSRIFPGGPIGRDYTKENKEHRGPRSQRHKGNLLSNPGATATVLCGFPVLSLTRHSYQCLERKQLFMRTSAMQSGSRNCSPPPALVL